ncbi:MULTISPECIES: hypothetical protein [unclassified Leptolyngbya]|uniref:HTH-like domain-containing protein n=1 Tax=unclassified Leptolyngbya TaxID=2650499 RepID=UPI0016847814|nr:MULTISPECIES: hypothetical protein [unclassified Leptolyngbya]MBD1911449.1 hypothetical protein [Leptolyngbya sp. FACHB-8]MBD2153461.1 hypothetical protein [Leptolyngbya sp. FACHB-16]
MTDEQKAILESIRARIELAKAQGDGTKTAEMNMQFLIHAPILQSLDFAEVMKELGLSDSFKTELSKMVNLYKQLKLNGISLTKTF